MSFDLYPRPAVPVLGPMARDVREIGMLRQPTAAAMWGAYLAHALATGTALARTDNALPAPPWVTRIGTAAAALGAGLCVAGMSRFGGFRQLEGTQTQDLTSTGIYSWSRNPQYLGYLVALGGASVARRSAAGVALTVLITLAYASWIRVEEEQLHERYGEPYDRYRATTHRWFGKATR